MKSIVEAHIFKSKMAIANVYDVIKLNVKSLMHRTEILFIILSFFIMSLLISVIYTPYYICIPAFYLGYEILPVLIILGWTGWSMRKSTLFQNLRSSGIGRFSFYCGQLLTAFFIANVLSLLFWPIVWLFAKLGWFKIGWGSFIDNYGSQSFNIFQYGTIFYILYIAELNIALSFALYFILSSIIKDIRAYYAIVFSLFLLGIIFGGAVNDYYVMPPGHYTYVDSIQKVYNDHEVATEDIPYIYEDGVYKIIVDFAYWDEIQETQQGMTFFAPQGGFFPNSLFIPSMFHPFFGSGQLASSTIGTMPTQDIRWGAIGIQISGGGGEYFSPAKLTQMGGGSANWLSYFVVNLDADKGWMWLMVWLQPYITILAYAGIGTLILRLKRDI